MTRPQKITTPDEVLDAISRLTDAQIAAIALSNGNRSVVLQNHVEYRFEGTRHVPGLPYGVERTQDGHLMLEHVALMRINPEFHLTAAKRLVAKSLWTLWAVAIASCVISAGVATWWLQTSKSRPLVAPIDIPPPCLVAMIAADSVVCHQGDSMLTITKHHFFPDGRFRLEAVLPGQTGFTATLAGDPRLMIFQVDSKSPQH
jgi:hypothetical protein